VILKTHFHDVASRLRQLVVVNVPYRTPMLIAIHL
jgi:hypothetical protein